MKTSKEVVAQSFRTLTEKLQERAASPAVNAYDAFSCAESDIHFIGLGHEVQYLRGAFGIYLRGLVEPDVPTDNDTSEITHQLTANFVGCMPLSSPASHARLGKATLNLHHDEQISVGETHIDTLGFYRLQSKTLLAPLGPWANWAIREHINAVRADPETRLTYPEQPTPEQFAHIPDFLDPKITSDAYYTPIATQNSRMDTIILNRP